MASFARSLSANCLVVLIVIGGFVLAGCNRSSAEQAGATAQEASRSHPAIHQPSAPPRENGSVWVELGTQAGPIPSATRSQPGHLLIYGDQKILIDVGDGVCEQLAKAGVSLRDVRTVFISHLHFDHIGGLFAFLSLRYQDSGPFTSSLTIYGPPGTKALVTALREAIKKGQPLFPRPIPHYRVIELKDKSTVTVGDVKVTAATNTHYALMSAADRRTHLSLSYRFDMPGRSIVYTGDTGPSVNVEYLAQGADLLVSEIMDLNAIKKLRQERYGKLPSWIVKKIDAHHTKEHLLPNQVGLLAARAGVRSLVLTHFGGDLGKPSQIKQLTAEIAKYYHGPIRFANDLDRFGGKAGASNAGAKAAAHP